MRELIRILQQSTENESSRGVDYRQLLVEIGTNALLFLLIFGMAGTVDIRNLKRQLRNRYAILTGIAMQFIIMPLLGFLAVIALKDHGLTTSMGITLLIVTASPGGSYSNWWCSLFNADLALSVAMTALSTILSIGLLPANLMLYAHAAYGFNAQDDQNVLKSVDFVALFVSLAIVIGAILAGLYASYQTDNVKFRKASNALGSFAGLALIVLSAIFSTSAEGAKPWEQHWTFYIGVAAPCVFGLFLANIIAKFAKLEKPEIVTLSVECCYQNVGIATSAVLAMFDDSEEVARAMAVPLFYGLMEAAVLGCYCLMAWKLGWTKAPKDEQICLVLVKTYEIDEDDEERALTKDGDKESDDTSKAISTAQTMSTTGSSKQDSDGTASNTGTNTELSVPSPQSRLESVEEYEVNPDRLGIPRNQSEGDLSYDISTDAGLSLDSSLHTRNSWLKYVPFQRKHQSELPRSPPLYQSPLRQNRTEEWHPRGGDPLSFQAYNNEGSGKKNRNGTAADEGNMSQTLNDSEEFSC